MEGRAHRATETESRGEETTEAEREERHSQGETGRRKEHQDTRKQREDGQMRAGEKDWEIGCKRHTDIRRNRKKERH